MKNILLVAMLCIIVVQTTLLALPTPAHSKDNFCLSDDGVKFLTEHEGVVYKIYNDIAGYPTGGIGHKLSKKENLQYNVGDKIDEATTISWFVEDVREACAAIDFYVKVPLTINEKDAIVSFIYNIGNEAFAESTFLRELNRKQYLSASREFTRWIWAGGKRSKGLLNRRLSEQELFRKK